MEEVRSSCWLVPGSLAICLGQSLSRVWFRQDFKTAAQWVESYLVFPTSGLPWCSGWLSWWEL